MNINLKRQHGMGGRCSRRLFHTLVAFLLLVPGWAAAQQESVILPVREVSVKTALESIERQTGYTIAVNWESIDEQNNILFPANRLTVGEILDLTLAGSGLVWGIIDDSRIAIMYGDEAPKPHKVPEISHSTMNRDELPDDMRVVPDRWSSVQISSEEIARIRNGFWRVDNTGSNDSIALAVLNFRVNSTTLERDYMDNARTLELIHRTFSDKDLLTAMDFITVTAAASPEGNTAANERLATNRAMAVKSYIMWRYPFMNRERIFTFSIGEDWTGLRKLVEEDMNTPFRTDVLAALDSDYDSQTKRSILRSIGSGTAYRYIARNMLPKLRGAAACMIYYKQKPEPERIVDTVYIEREVRVDSIVRMPVEVPVRTPYYWAVKTNLLYDAALLPDLHLEFSIGQRWSVEFGGQWSWWTSNKSHNNTWRIQTAGLEGRYWLGDRSKRTPLSGHFLGVYGMAGTYDVRFGAKTGYLSDMSYSAGISYGYSTRLSRSLSLEFGISVGYMGGKYKTYHIYDEAQNIFYKDGHGTRHWFGPTKARISLVWLPGGKNHPKNR